MKLIDFTKDKTPHGNSIGREILSKMRDYIESNNNIVVFEISFEGIEFIDASFSRESIIYLAQFYKGKKGFYISNLFDQDLIDNISYAAIALDQPITLKNKDNETILIGPMPTKSNLEIYNFVKKKKQVTTSQLASTFDLSVQNASIKLKKLVDEGYILRFEEIAESGGIEYLYKSIE